MNDYAKGNNISIWLNSAKNQIFHSITHATFPLKATPCFKIYSGVSNNDGFTFLELLYETYDSVSFPQGFKSAISLETVTILLLGNPKHIMAPQGYRLSAIKTPKQADLSQIMLLTQEEITKCEKSVLVIEASESVAELEYLTKKFPHIDFYKSKDTLRLAPFGWSFVGQGESRINKYFQSIVETGIQGRLDYERRMRKITMYNSKLKEPARKDIPLGFDGALITLFILCGSTVFAAVLANVAELWPIWKMLFLLTKAKLSNLIYQFIHMVANRISRWMI
ncbi:hypothetical protein Fcan01_19319 [Folsomia candida]|uniref:Uncharacterized protein n=1 Tax=Folsomia candida TaxID=158441 RepID=A0A226DLT8_FOLCA|nr:hypothetical protein Fcan01_19319 [Folsomia candida]